MIPIGGADLQLTTFEDVRRQFVDLLINAITEHSYREIGGVKGALSQHAEETYQALPSDEYRQMARDIFLRLIEPGTTEQDTTRRRAPAPSSSGPIPCKRSRCRRRWRHSSERVC